MQGPAAHAKECTFSEAFSVHLILSRAPLWLRDLLQCQRLIALQARKAVFEHFQYADPEICSYIPQEDHIS